MALYYFDLVDGETRRDDTGTECETLEDVRRAAMSTLPEIASEQISRDSNRRFFTIIARDESGRAVFMASLTFVGLWLNGSESPSAADIG